VLYSTGRRIKPADKIALLNREPENAVLIEGEAVRIFCVRIRQRVFGHDAGVWIELADQSGKIAGEPNIPRLVVDQSMRAGEGGLECIFLDRTGFRIDPAELVGQLR